jgi:branched-chain amino acid transport system permease protein
VLWWDYITGSGVSLVLIALRALPIVNLGGLESVPGVLVGAVVLGIVESLTAGYIDRYLGVQVSRIVVHVVWIVVLVNRSCGIFGRADIRRV